MLIEIICSNPPLKPKPDGEQVCGEKLIVRSEQIGEFVECSRCGQQVEVIPSRNREKAAKSKPTGSRTSADQKVRSKASRSPSATKSSGQSRRKRSTAATDAKSGARAPRQTKRTTKKSSDNLGDEMRLADPIKRQKVDVMQMDLGRENVEGSFSETKKELCSKCGNVVDRGRCTVCNLVQPRFAKLYQPLDEMKMEVAGFQRWFSRIMNEGASIGVIAMAAHVLIGMLLAVLAVLSISMIMGFGPGPGLGTAALIFVAVMAFLYVGNVVKAYQFLRDPKSRLAWFQKPFWLLMLYLARRMGWAGYDSRLKGRKIITVRDRQFGDKDILGLEGLAKCQVIDLEGTLVTDDGLLELYLLKHLQVVVLRKTNVTHEGVQRFQQSFPRIWIWY